MDPRLVLAEENKRLATTLQHYRNWAGQILARYQMANPDAARPPRRIYVGGLPTGTTEVSPAEQHTSGAYYSCCEMSESILSCSLSASNRTISTEAYIFLTRQCLCACLLLLDALMTVSAHCGSSQLWPQHATPELV